MITKQEFDSMCNDYLETTKGSSRESMFVNQHEMAEIVFKSMNRCFFVVDASKEARRAQYEELKKEFE